MFYQVQTLCGCWYSSSDHRPSARRYLPLVDLTSSTTIISTVSRTKLIQTFHNPSKSDKLEEVRYTFPLYDGVSVVGFKCTVAGRTIFGVVKEKQQAGIDYKEAIDRGETAGLLEQVPEASDAFTTKIGNIPADEKIIVEIEYLGELKHDAETDGSRFTIPNVIAPRYGSMSAETQSNLHSSAFTSDGRINILVDIVIDEGSIIRGIQSPSHPIAVTMGRISTTEEEDAFHNHHASATLTLGSTELEKDFVIVVLAKGQDIPHALLETHPTLPNHRALMATLVPKFNLPNIHPEIVFVVDRSGSMDGKITTLVSAMKVFLKSLPVGVKFNICSFGSRFDFMFKKSVAYSQNSLQEALNNLASFGANYGGTEIAAAVRGTVENRFKDMPLEMMLLTDGEIWRQQELFDYINEVTRENVRIFSLGIGSGASSSLVEGIARAGDGFAQFVDDNEKMDKRVVRMLKGALTPRVKDYRLEVKYDVPGQGEDFEMVESVDGVLLNVATDLKKAPPPYTKKILSLFDTSAKEEPTNPPTGRYEHLPKIASPSLLQAPHKIPSLYPFNRTTVYLLIGPDACQQRPKAIILRGTSAHCQLELEIPVQDIGVGQTIHQLAAKKAAHELEQGRGWLTEAKSDGKLVKSRYEGRWDEIVEREAVRLGVEYQVAGKFCSFVAVEKSGPNDEVVDQASWKIAEKPEAPPGAVFGGGQPRGRGAGGLFGALGGSASLSSSSQPQMTGVSLMSPSEAVFRSKFHGLAQSCRPSATGAGLFQSISGTNGGLFGSSNTLSGFGCAKDPQPAVNNQQPSFTSFSSEGRSKPSLFASSSQQTAGTPGAWEFPQTSTHASLFSSSLPSFTDNDGGLAKKKSFRGGLFGGSLFGDSRSSLASAPPPQPARPMQKDRRCQKASEEGHSAEKAAGRGESKDLLMDLCLTPSATSTELKSDVQGSSGRNESTSLHKPDANDLIDLQNFDGSWDGINGICRFIDLEVFEKVEKLFAEKTEKDKLTATVLAIAYLETKLASAEEVWDMVVEKAKNWLITVGGTEAMGHIKTAKEMLQ